MDNTVGLASTNYSLPCPTCGRCPTCGQYKSQYYYPYIPYSPYYGPQYIYCGGTTTVADTMS